MELHERVRYLRTEILNNMSQADFAKILRVSRDEINNIEGNRLKRPEQKESLLLLMCSKFGVSEDWLLHDIGDPRPTVEDSEAAYVEELLEDSDNPLNGIIKSVMKAYFESSKEDQEAIKKFASAILDNQKKESQD